MRNKVSRAVFSGLVVFMFLGTAGRAEARSSKPDSPIVRIVKAIAGVFHPHPQEDVPAPPRP